MAVVGALLIGALGIALIVDACRRERSARPAAIIDLRPRTRRVYTSRRRAPTGSTRQWKAVEYVDHDPGG